MRLKDKVNRLTRFPGCNFGGGDSKTTQEPWGAIQPQIIHGVKKADELFNQGPIQPYAGPQQATLPSGWADFIQGNIATTAKRRENYYPTLDQKWVDMLDPNRIQATQVGAQQVSPLNVDLGQYGYERVSPGMVNPSQTGWAQVGQSGVNADPTINKLLSGAVDNPYISGMAQDITGRTQSAFDEMLRNTSRTLGEQILPGIEQGFNMAGQLGQSRQALLEGQAIGRTGEEMARQGRLMSDALAGQLSNLYGGLYNSAQDRAAAVAQEMAGIGSQERLTQANLEQQARLANAGYGMQAGLANQQTGLQGQLANQQALRDYWGLTQAGQLANQQAGMQGQLANQQTNLQAQLANQQALLDAQKYGSQLSQQAMGLAGMIQGLPYSEISNALSAYAPILQQQQGSMDIAKQQYYEGQNAPWENLAKYMNVLIPGAGLGGTVTDTGGGNKAAGAIGGALTGMALNATELGGAASWMLGPWALPLMLGGAALLQ